MLSGSRMEFFDIFHYPRMSVLQVPIIIWGLLSLMGILIQYEVIPFFNIDFILKRTPNFNDPKVHKSGREDKVIAVPQRALTPERSQVNLATCKACGAAMPQVNKFCTRCGKATA
jgi:hypothetical protein